MRPGFKFSVMLAAGLVAGGTSAVAASIDSASSEAMESYGRKVNFDCGTNISMHYDVESLKKNNKDIGWGQTEGSNQCNEALRYIWYACKSPAGKAAVKKLNLTKIVCKGVSGKTGKLSRAGGVITIERAYEESKPHERSLKQFQAATGITVKPKDPDPYHDNDWDTFRRKENPVTDTKNYCMLDNDKKPFDDSSAVYSSYEYQKKTGTVKCWKNGRIYTDLKFTNGMKTGLVTNSRDDVYWTDTYKDGRQDGLAQRFEKGRLVSEDWYKAGDRIWDKSYYPNGKLKSYDLKIPNNVGYGRISFQEDGKVDSIECRPEVRGDKILEKVCGFGKPMTVKVYDRSGKVENTYVFRDGLKQSQTAGESERGSKSDVKFVNGKRNGPEKVYTKGGKLAALIQWKDGVRNGPEKQFHTDGKKVVKLINWKSDVVADQTEFYLNGNPKTKETFLSERKKNVQEYFDSGKIREEGMFVMCRSAYYNRWCEDGMHRNYFQDGKRYSETSYKEGVRSGTSRSWYQNGKLSEQVEYVDGKMRSSRYYDDKGNLREAAEYEEDGSKKVKKK
jgi:antitoxin component YwqK of YwqJK toxin-antitoxin module